MTFTSFHPSLHGFPFENDFTNTVGIGPAKITTKGRCGGMAYTALDCYLAQAPVPTDVNSVGDHLLARQLESMAEMGPMFLAKFAQQIAPEIEIPLIEERIGPGKSAQELFNSGLDYGDGVVNLLNQGKPVPLGLVTIDFSPGDNHQVLAIGYESHAQRERRILYIYDPNNPMVFTTLTPDAANHRFVSREVKDPKNPKPPKEPKEWRTLFHANGFSSKPPPPANGMKWVGLDDNPLSVELAADGHSLYQRHSNGWIWRVGGVEKWQALDNNSATKKIVAAGGNLYQLHQNGHIWKFTGVPMTGWLRLDTNPATVDIVAAGSALYQLHGNGRIWKFTGTPLSGWQELDNNPATKKIVAAGANLYQLHQGGHIWKYTGVPMKWLLLDSNNATVDLTGDNDRLYQLHSDGSIWIFTGTPLTGWQKINANPATKKIATAGGHVYQLHNNGSVWKYVGIPMTGWEQLDNNPLTADIAASGNYLYQIHKNGHIWRR